MTQLFHLDSNDNIFLINTIPIHLENTDDKLSNNDWDWLVQKRIENYDNNLIANKLGVLQIITTRAYQKKDSKVIIIKSKKLLNKYNYQNFIIPIHPTLKWKHPEIKMTDLLNLKKNFG